MPPGVGPGINWSGPCAVRLNGDVVNTSDDSEETLFTPVSAPRVSDNPVLSAVFDSESNNRDIMDYVQVTCLIIVNTTGVSLERIGDCDTASNGTALINLLHHVFLTGNRAELVDLEDTVLFRDVTFAAARIASLANVDRGAIDAVVVTASLVDGAGLIGDVVGVHELEGREGLTAVAAVIIHGA